MGTMILFPLLFLSTTFVPMNLIEKGWFKVAATINPTTYIFDGMRALLIEGWMPNYVYYGLIIGFGSALVTSMFATVYGRKVFSA
jgi:ABC-2 type transport system permease protein